MVRMTRYVVPGQPQHVIQRGSIFGVRVRVLYGNACHNIRVVEI